MTDQPETMLEYHFRKLERKVVGVAMLVIAALYLAAAAIVMNSTPGIGFVLLLGSLMMALASYGAGEGGVVRRSFNWLFRADVSDIERPDTAADSEVLADD